MKKQNDKMQPNTKITIYRADGTKTTTDSMMARLIKGKKIDRNPRNIGYDDSFDISDR